MKKNFPDLFFPDNFPFPSSNSTDEIWLKGFSDSDVQDSQETIQKDEIISLCDDLISSVSSMPNIRELDVAKRLLIILGNLKDCLKEASSEI